MGIQYTVTNNEYPYQDNYQILNKSLFVTVMSAYSSRTKVFDH